MIYRKRKDAQVLDIYGNINSDSFLKMPGTKNWLTKGEDEIFYNERESENESERHWRIWSAYINLKRAAKGAFPLSL